MFDSRAILLRRRVFRENDYLLTVFTERDGKRVLLGRGMQKSTSKLAAHCADFFIVTRVRWVSGVRFNTITSAQWERQFERIGSDLIRIGAGFQMLEAVDVWTREDIPEPSLWRTLVDAMEELERSPRPSDVHYAFAMRALALLGWSLKLDQCLHCHRLFTVGARLHPASGGGWCGSCRGTSPGIDSSQNDLIVLRYLQSDQWRNVSPDQLRSVLPIIHESIALHRESPWSSDQWVDWVGRPLYARA